MSLNFEQSKEVVEKVWGCRVISQEDYDCHSIILQNGVNEYDFNSECFGGYVCSWGGFGRTVEAMEKRGVVLVPYYSDFNETIPNGNPYAEKRLGLGFYTGYYPYHHEIKYEDNQIVSLITATHLAALEAIKQEGEG